MANIGAQISLGELSNSVEAFSVIIYLKAHNLKDCPDPRA